MRRMLAVGHVAIALVLAGGIQAQAGLTRAQAFKAQSPAPLENTRWTLISVQGKKVERTSPRAAFIQLDPASHRLTGSGGCNQLTGGYQLEGNHLRLTGTARTMMACAGGMDVENQLVKALEDVRQWKLSGEALELLDGNGDVVARFSAGGTPEGR